MWLLLPNSWIVAKFTIIGIILGDAPALHQKNNLQHLYIPTRNWYIYWDNIRWYHCITWEKIICIICMYPKMFPTVHHREFSYMQGNVHYYLAIFYQLLYSNQYFNRTPVLSRIHTSLSFHFHIWTFVSQTSSLAISVT